MVAVVVALRGNNAVFSLLGCVAVLAALAALALPPGVSVARAETSTTTSPFFPTTSSTPFPSTPTTTTTTTTTTSPPYPTTNENSTIPFSCPLAFCDVYFDDFGSICECDLERKRGDPFDCIFEQRCNHVLLDGYVNTLSPRISNATFITYLELYSLNVTELPDLSQLPLTDLLIDGTSLTTFPYLNSSVESVTISYSFLSDLTPLYEQHLPNLFFLSFTENSLANIGPVETLDGLFSLDVSWNLIDTFPDLSHLKDLRLLDVSHNSLEDFSAFHSLHQLVRFDGNDNYFEFVGQGIGSMVNLEYLSMPQNLMRLLDDDVLYLTNLTYLDMRSNLLRDDFLPRNLSQLANLEHLDLTDNFLRELPYLPKNLSVLLAAYNYFTDLAVDIGTYNLRVIDISQNQFEFIPFVVVFQPYCHTLLMNENFLVSVDYYIQYMTSLKTLSVNQNGLISVAPEICLHATQIAIGDNQLGEIPESLLGCENIDFLDLSSNLIYDVSQEAVDFLHNVTFFTMARNPSRCLRIYDPDTTESTIVCDCAERYFGITDCTSFDEYIFPDNFGTATTPVQLNIPYQSAYFHQNNFVIFPDIEDRDVGISVQQGVLTHRTDPGLNVTFAFAAIGSAFANRYLGPLFQGVTFTLYQRKSIFFAPQLNPILRGSLDFYIVDKPSCFPEGLTYTPHGTLHGTPTTSAENCLIFLEAREETTGEKFQFIGYYLSVYDCGNNTCNGRGTCDILDFAYDGIFHCDCRDGYTGRRCEQILVVEVEIDSSSADEARRVTLGVTLTFLLLIGAAIAAALIYRYYKDSDRTKLYHFFISYRRGCHDELARSLCVNLQKCFLSTGHQVTVFWDQQDIEVGDDWRDEFQSGVKKSCVFVPLLSNASLESLKAPPAHDIDEAVGDDEDFDSDDVGSSHGSGHGSSTTTANNNSMGSRKQPKLSRAASEDGEKRKKGDNFLLEMEIAVDLLEKGHLKILPIVVPEYTESGKEVPFSFDSGLYLDAVLETSDKSAADSDHTSGKSANTTATTTTATTATPTSNGSFAAAHGYYKHQRTVREVMETIFLRNVHKLSNDRHVLETDCDVLKEFLEAQAWDGEDEDSINNLQYYDEKKAAALADGSAGRVVDKEKDVNLQWFDEIISADLPVDDEKRGTKARKVAAQRAAFLQQLKSLRGKIETLKRADRAKSKTGVSFDQEYNTRRRNTLNRALLNMPSKHRAELTRGAELDELILEMDGDESVDEEHELTIVSLAKPNSSSHSDSKEAKKEDGMMEGAESETAEQMQPLTVPSLSEASNTHRRHSSSSSTHAADGSDVVCNNPLFIATSSQRNGGTVDEGRTSPRTDASHRIASAPVNGLGARKHTVFSKDTRPKKSSNAEHSEEPTAEGSFPSSHGSAKPSSTVVLGSNAVAVSFDEESDVIHKGSEGAPRGLVRQESEVNDGCETMMSIPNAVSQPSATKASSLSSDRIIIVNKDNGNDTVERNETMIGDAADAADDDDVNESGV